MQEILLLLALAVISGGLTGALGRRLFDLHDDMTCPVHSSKQKHWIEDHLSDFGQE